MNFYDTCQTCLYNEDNHCENEDSPYCGSPLRSWSSCSQHEASRPIIDGLIARLGVCAEGLDRLSESVPSEHSNYYRDRAAQCRKWITELTEGLSAADVEEIADGLRGFEAMAL